MELADLPAAESLRILLDDQCRNLRIAADRLESLHLTGVHVVQPTQWSGRTRVAHDQLAELMLASLRRAQSAVNHAADESARAVATLASRVG